VLRHVEGEARIDQVQNTRFAHPVGLHSTHRGSEPVILREQTIAPRPARKRPPAERLFGLVYAPAATQYKVDAFLEGGARDCAVYLVVPTNLKSFKLQVDHVVADLDPESGETRYISTVSAGRAVAGRAHPTAFTVTLPEFNQKEWAASLGVKTGTIGSAGPIAVQMMMPPNSEGGGPAKNK